jgi:hypothetical protein
MPPIFDSAIAAKIIASVGNGDAFNWLATDSRRAASAS